MDCIGVSNTKRRRVPPRRMYNASERQSQVPQISSVYFLILIFTPTFGGFPEGVWRMIMRLRSRCSVIADRVISQDQHSCCRESHNAVRALTSPLDDHRYYRHFGWVGQFPYHQRRHDITEDSPSSSSTRLFQHCYAMRQKNIDALFVLSLVSAASAKVTAE